VFYNPLLACPACVNQEVRESSGVGPEGDFSCPELVRGACVARDGMPGVQDNPALVDGSQGQTLAGLRDAGAPALAHRTARLLFHHKLAWQGLRETRGLGGGLSANEVLGGGCRSGPFCL